ncbi:MAG: hypothetical protein V4609_13355 [Pseudomonadota bacterium]
MLPTSTPARSPVQVSNSEHPRFGQAGVTIRTPLGNDDLPVDSAVVVLFDSDKGDDFETVARADLRQL